MSVTAKTELRFFLENGESVLFKTRLVKSSNVMFVGWPTTGEPMMLVGFKGGARYGYLGVPRQRVVAAANAKSVGSYVNQKIKPNYKAVRLG